MKSLFHPIDVLVWLGAFALTWLLFWGQPEYQGRVGGALAMTMGIYYAVRAARLRGKNR